MSHRLLLRRRTCLTCPFKGGFHLDRRRRQEIYTSVILRDATFHCHSEIDYSQDDDDGDTVADTYGAGQCAGATTLNLREGHYNQVMRWAPQVGEEPSEDPAVPFDSWSEWINETEYATDRADGGTGEPCSVVDDGCLHPAGWGGGGGVARNHAANAEYECTECGDPVCANCCDDNQVCNTCNGYGDEEE